MIFILQIKFDIAAIKNFRIGNIKKATYIL